MKRVKLFFSKDGEPLRRSIYGIVGPLLLALVTQGIVTYDMANIIIGVVGTFLIIPATEWARTKVTPQAAVEGKIIEAVIEIIKRRRASGGAP